MQPVDVHYADLRTTPRQNLLDKVEALLGQAGLASRVSRGDLVAVKLHFGEKGNTAFLRPIFVRRVIEALKALGAKPFVTDANTLYVGTRSDSVSHLETAIQNGFDFAVIGAPLVIADGLRGHSAVRVPIRGRHFSEVSIGAEIAHADAIVALTHFKGHELSGFGGTLKNVGMGCAAREGKLAQHSTLGPEVKDKLCVACGECVPWCAQGAIAVGESAFIDPERCVGCGQCILICPQGAIQVRWDESPAVMQEKMAEHCLGALQGKRDKSLFVNFVSQVSPACDCYGHADAPIVADLGFLASTDPVAIDQASVDLVNAQQGNLASALKGGLAPGEDKFRGLYPQVDWSVQLTHAETLGLGTRTYRRLDLASSRS